MKKILLVLIILVPYLLNSQWGNDPAVNTAVCDLAGSQAVPKTATSTEGDTYIGWFSNETGNYDVRLQRFDSDGNELWEHNGILISNHPSMTWLTDWDMTVDGANHAILTFQDIRNGGNNNVYVYRISPSGEFIWGVDGLELSNSVAFDVSPKVAVTGIGNAVIAWQADDVIIMQKIAPDGTLLWGDNGITLTCANTYSWPQLLPVGTDDVIMKFFEDSGMFPMTTRHVYAQRFDADGNPLWADNTVISNAGGISVWNQIFPMVSDRNSGFFIAWDDDRDNNMLEDSFIQHVDADGQTLFPNNGLEVSLMTGRNHFYPEIAFPENSTDVFVFWNEMDGGQNQRGIYGQKISNTGDRLWTDNGMAFIHLTATDVLPIATRSTESDIVVFYKENLSPVNNQIKAMMIDPDGAFVWDDGYITLSSVASEKLHNVVSHYFNNQWIAVWEDRRIDNGDIYAQNINLDGTLGPQVIGVEENLHPEIAGFNLRNYPNPFNPETIISFSTTELTENTEINIYNINGQKVKQLVSEQLSAGQYSVVWNGKDDSGETVSSGVYFYKMDAGKYSSTKKMILMK
ncbi:MAG: T9SS type A sorting domain-containing protein [Armatimonadetes bacterium]|nr:T9SS type A sorting domain-containing protein [Armatimonadota bacterium]